MKRSFCLFLMIIPFISCGQSEKASHIIRKWIGKEIVYSNDIFFTLGGQDTIKRILPVSPYTIISYVDSTGCVDCKLRLPKWNRFISELDSISQSTIPVLFFFHSKREDIVPILKRNGFNRLVCIDENDSFNRLNHFSTLFEYQTLLLDKDHKVIAIGNPIHNPQIKELYLNIIQGKSPGSNKRDRILTKVSMKNGRVFWGKFDWKQEQKAEFSLANTGNAPLVIDDVNTSCGCISVDYSKEPVPQGGSVSLHVVYKADHPEYFDKTITVYCNAESSPVVFRITGDAQ